MKTRLPLFHLRRQLRQQGQELRRAQRQAEAAHLAALDSFADQVAAQHQAFVARLAADQERLTKEAEGPPELLAALRGSLH